MAELSWEWSMVFVLIILSELVMQTLKRNIESQYVYIGLVQV